MNEEQDRTEKTNNSVSYGIDWGSMTIALKVIIICTIVFNVMLTAALTSYKWITMVIDWGFGA